MGVTTKKYGLSVSFCSKMALFGKTVQLWILVEKLNFFKTRKNSYTGQLQITDPQYGGHDQEI
jgi:hypothetical protein